jgi:LysM repeat protein
MGVLLLVSFVLAVSLALGAPGATPPRAAPSTPTSLLPVTVPGLSRDEGVFMITGADDGSRAVYFIAQNTRHSVTSSDFQLEQRLNPLWPVRSASRDEILAFDEAGPVGTAKAGLISSDTTAGDAANVAEASPDDDAVADEPSPVADEAPSTPVAMPGRAAPSHALAMPIALASGPAASPMPHTAIRAQNPIELQPDATAEMQPEDAESAMYVVQSGDNLTRLSARYATTIAAILDANGIKNANLVYIGQPLVIPTSTQAPAAPTPAATNFPEPVADLAVRHRGPTTYTVVPGDSALIIAYKFGVDVNELLAINAIVNRNRVYAGQVLTLPRAAS